MSGAFGGAGKKRVLIFVYFKMIIFLLKSTILRKALFEVKVHMKTYFFTMVN
jgi:hypothetical protein